MPKWQNTKTCSQKAEILRRYRRFIGDLFFNEADFNISISKGKRKPR